MEGNDRSPGDSEWSAGRLHQLLILGGLGLFVLALLLSGIFGGPWSLLPFLDDNGGPAADDDFIESPPDDTTGEADDEVGIVEMSADERVEAGEPIAVEYTIENEGDSEVERSVSLTFAGSDIAVDELALAPGETTAVEHVVETEGVDPGEHDLEIASEGIGERVTVTVEDPTGSSFTVTALSAPETAAVGEDVPVEYTIENTGDDAGSTDVTLTVAGDPIAEGSVSLEPDESASGSAVLDTSGMDPGEYSIELSTDDDEEQVDLTLEEAGEAEVVVTDLDVPDDGPTDGAFEVEYTVENVGDADGSAAIETRFDGSTVNEQSVTLDEGASATETVVIETDGESEGMYPVDVVTEHETERAWIALEDEEAEFEITDADAPEEATEGDEIEVEFTIENVGAAEGETPVTVSFDGDVVAEDQVELDAGESLDAVARIDTEGYGEGEHPVDIEVDGDEQREWVQLEADDDDGIGLLGLTAIPR